MSSLPKDKEVQIGVLDIRTSMIETPEQVAARIDATIAVLPVKYDTVFGLGILGVAAGSVFGLMASSAWSTSKSDCSSSLRSQCPNYDDAVSKHDTASTDATVSTIAFAVGGVALATSVVLFLTAPSSRSATGSGATGLRLEASLAPGSAGITLAGGFR